MQIIDGKATSLAIQDEIKEEVQKRVAAGAKKPHLAAIIVLGLQCLAGEFKQGLQNIQIIDALVA